MAGAMFELHMLLPTAEQTVTLQEQFREPKQIPGGLPEYSMQRLAKKNGFLLGSS